MRTADVILPIIQNFLIRPYVVFCTSPSSYS